MTGPSRLGRYLVGAGIVLFAFNLRIAVGSIGVVLGRVSAELDMSPSTAGLLTALPLLCYALIGIASGKIVRAVGLHRTAVLVLVVIAVGLLLRALAPGALSFLLATALALCAAAVGNVILPSLVKINFPHRVPLMSALYGAALLAGVVWASAVTVPIAEVFGSWRAGLGAWSALAVLVILPWLGSLRRDLHVDPNSTRLRNAEVLRSRTTWAFIACFGVQTAHAYAQFGWLPAILIDAGVSEVRAGLLFSLLPGVGIPLTLCLPWLIRKDPGAVLPIAFGGATAAGWLGLLVAPTTLTWLWVALLGAGGVTFIWTLTMIGGRARTAEGVAALSSATQGIGYLIASIGPLGAGLLHDVTGSWDEVVVVFAAGSTLITVCAIAVSRAAVLEDDIGRGRARRTFT